MKTHEDIYKGLPAVAAGAVAAAAAGAAQVILRAWKYYYAGEFAAYALLIIGWILILLGTRMISDRRAGFRMSGVAAFAGTICALAAAGLSALNFRHGLEAQSFVEMKVMFFYFVSVVCLLCIYAFLLRALAEVGEEIGQERYARTCGGTWISVVTVTAAALVLAPAVSVFPKAVEWVLVIVIAGVSLIYQIRAAILINRGRSAAVEK